jgi:hypothetical protein
MTKKPNARTLWIQARAAELVAKGWRQATAEKRATKE